MTSYCFQYTSKHCTKPNSLRNLAIYHTTICILLKITAKNLAAWGAYSCPALTTTPSQAGTHLAHELLFRCYSTHTASQSFPIYGSKMQPNHQRENLGCADFEVFSLVLEEPVTQGLGFSLGSQSIPSREIFWENCRVNDSKLKFNEIRLPLLKFLERTTKVNVFSLKWLRR